MAILRGVYDKKAIKVKCPKCEQLLLFVNKDARGKIYPYCKKCHINVDIHLPFERP